MAEAALLQDELPAEAHFRGRQAMADQRLEAALNLFRLARDIEPSPTATALRLLRQLAARAETSDEASA